jgi:hypothetical protein
MRAFFGLALVLVAAAPARADWSVPVVLSDVATIPKGTQRVAGNAAGDAVVRPPGESFPGKVTALGPEANNHPPSLVASGAGAVVAWPIGTSPPRPKHVMTAVAFRGTPLIAFASRPRGRDGRLRVRLKTSVAVK